MCLGPSQSGSLSASWTVGFSSSDPPRSLPGVYGLGRLQEHDPRSLRFAVEVPDRDPTNKTWRCGVVLNQGHTSACTGFSRVADLLAAPRMVKVDDPQDMAQRTYKLAQTLDEWPGEDYEGSSVLGALKAVPGLGFIGEYRWAFDFGDWLRSLSYVGPSVVGTTFFNSMFEPSERGVLTVNPSSGEAGGHAYLIRAIVTDERRKKRIVGSPNNRDGVPLLRVRNSWGHGWGKAGDAYMWADDYQKHLWPGGEQSIVVKALHR
jgi:hypothetical protein